MVSEVLGSEVFYYQQSQRFIAPHRYNLVSKDKKERQYTNEATWANRTNIDNIIESYGPCTRFNKCKTIGTLGNGLCQACWDRGMYRNRRIAK